MTLRKTELLWVIRFMHFPSEKIIPHLAAPKIVSSTTRAWRPPCAIFALPAMSAYSDEIKSILFETWGAEGSIRRRGQGILGGSMPTPKRQDISRYERLRMQASTGTSSFTGHCRMALKLSASYMAHNHDALWLIVKSGESNERR